MYWVVQPPIIIKQQESWRTAQVIEDNDEHDLSIEWELATTIYCVWVCNIGGCTPKTRMLTWKKLFIQQHSPWLFHGFHGTCFFFLWMVQICAQRSCPSGLATKYMMLNTNVWIQWFFHLLQPANNSWIHHSSSRCFFFDNSLQILQNRQRIKPFSCWEIHH